MMYTLGLYMYPDDSTCSNLRLKYKLDFRASTDGGHTLYIGEKVSVLPFVVGLSLAFCSRSM